jgi:hypothetical protein
VDNATLDVQTKNDGGPGKEPPFEEEEVICVECQRGLLEPEKSYDRQYAGHEQVVEARSVYGCAHRFLLAPIRV